MAKATAILSINAGSSSVKVTLFKVQGDSDQPEKVAASEVSRLSTPPAQFSYSRAGETYNHQLSASIKTQHDAFEYILDSFLNDSGLGIVSSHYTEQKLINEDLYGHIEALEDLAPLPQLSKVKNIASFDSAFHQHVSDHIKTYAINQRIVKEKEMLPSGPPYQHLQKKASELNIIALRLGSGASIKHGQSIDTSMGPTPVSGLPGGSRSGDIDPSLIFHYISKASQMGHSSIKDLHISEAEEILNKRSGWKALADTTDFPKIADPAAP